MKQTTFPLSDKEGVIIAEVSGELNRFDIHGGVVLMGTTTESGIKEAGYYPPLMELIASLKADCEIIGTYPLTEEQAMKVAVGYKNRDGELCGFANHISNKSNEAFGTAVESFSSLLKTAGVMLERHEVPFCWPEKTNKEIEESFNKWKEAEDQRWCKNGEKLLIIKYKKA